MATSLADLQKFVNSHNLIMQNQSNSFLSVLEGVFKRIEDLEEDRKKDMTKHSVKRLEQKISKIEFSLGNITLHNEVNSLEHKVAHALLKAPTPRKGEEVEDQARRGSIIKSKEGKEGDVESAKVKETEQGQPETQEHSPVNANAGETAEPKDDVEVGAVERLKIDSLFQQIAKTESRVNQMQALMAKQHEQIWDKLAMIDQQISHKKQPSANSSKSRGRSSRQLNTSSPKPKRHVTKEDSRKRATTDPMSVEESSSPKPKQHTANEETNKRAPTDPMLEVATVEDSQSQPRGRARTRGKSMDKEEVDSQKPAAPEQTSVGSIPQKKSPAEKHELAVKSSASLDVANNVGENLAFSPVDKPSEEQVQVLKVDTSMGDDEDDDDETFENEDFESLQALRAHIEQTRSEMEIAMNNMKAENDAMRVMVTNLQTAVSNCETTAKKTAGGLTELREFQDKFRSRKEKDELASDVAEMKMVKRHRKQSMKDDMEVKDGIEQIVKMQKLQDEATKGEAGTRNAILEKAYSTAAVLHQDIDRFVSGPSVGDDSFFTSKLSDTSDLCAECVSIVGDERTKTRAILLFNKLLVQCRRNSKITSNAVGHQMKRACADFEVFLNTFMKPFDTIAIVNDNLEKFEGQKGNQRDQNFKHSSMDFPDIHDLKMTLDSKLDSDQLQSFLKGKASVTYVENKIQDLEMHIQDSRSAIFSDSKFTDLQENVLKLLSQWERTVVKNKEISKCLSQKADRVELMDQASQLKKSVDEAQTAILALAQEATSMAEKREWLEGSLKSKADRADTEALWRKMTQSGNMGLGSHFMSIKQYIVGANQPLIHVPDEMPQEFPEIATSASLHSLQGGGNSDPSFTSMKGMRRPISADRPVGRGSPPGMKVTITKRADPLQKDMLSEPKVLSKYPRLIPTPARVKTASGGGGNFGAY